MNRTEIQTKFTRRRVESKLNQQRLTRVARSLLRFIVNQRKNQTKFAPRRDESKLNQLRMTRIVRSLLRFVVKQRMSQSDPRRIRGLLRTSRLRRNRDEILATNVSTGRASKALMPRFKKRSINADTIALRTLNNLSQVS